MADNPSPDRETIVRLYDALVETNPAIERKGAKFPYTSLNGNMFTIVSVNNEVLLRLPADEREAFLKKFDTTLGEAYGAVMKEYVTVPSSLLANTAELKPYLDMSYEYAKTLKPKPTKKT